MIWFSIFRVVFFCIFREYMGWPQRLYESGMNIEIVATASMASYGILKRLEWVATIWLQPILEDGICMFSTNTISIREFYKKETEIRSTSNTNPRYVVHSWTGNTMGYFLPKSVIYEAPNSVEKGFFTRYIHTWPEYRFGYFSQYYLCKKIWVF